MTWPSWVIHVVSSLRWYVYARSPLFHSAGGGGGLIQELLRAASITQIMLRNNDIEGEMWITSKYSAE